MGRGAGMIYSNIGKWQEAVKENPPHDVERITQESLVIKIRKGAKKTKVHQGDECFVCGDKMKEVLRKHHLVLVSAYPLFELETNKHMVLLCENHHTVAHCLIYNERGGLSWQSVQRLKAAGYWEAFCQLDKMAAEALKALTLRHKYINDNEQMRLAI